MPSENSQDTSTAFKNHKGDIDYSKLSPAEIQNLIDDFQNKIDELKIGSGKLSRSQKMTLIGYQEEVKFLRDQQQDIQNAFIARHDENNEKKDEAIENYDNALENFKEIKGFLDSKFLQSYTDLANKIHAGQALLESENPEKFISENIESITQEILAYLKHPQSRQTLAHISHTLKREAPAKYEAFKSYLIAQDAEFE